MKDDEAAAQVRAAIIAIDPAADIRTEQSRQFVALRSTMALPQIFAAINMAGFIVAAIPDRRRERRMDGIMLLAMRVFLFGLAGAFAGAVIDVLVGALEVGAQIACVFNSRTRDCPLDVPVLAIGFAAMCGLAAAVYVFDRDLRRLRLTWKRRGLRRRRGDSPALESTRRDDSDVARIDAIPGYVWVGRNPP